MAVRFIYSCRVDLNQRSSSSRHRRTAAHFAALGDKPGVLSALRFNGADMNIRDEFLLSPLLLLMTSEYEEDTADHVDTILALIQMDEVDVTLCLRNGKSAAHLAAAKGQVSVLHALSQRGADMSLAEPNGKATPLLLAIEHDRTDAALELLRMPELHFGHEETSFTSIEEALCKGNTEVVGAIVERFPDIDIAIGDDEPLTRIPPMEFAIYQGATRSVAFLLSLGYPISHSVMDFITDDRALTDTVDYLRYLAFNLISDNYYLSR